MQPAFTERTRERLIDFLSLRLNIPSEGVWSHYLEEGYEDEDWYEDFKEEQGASYQEHGCSKIVLFYEEFPYWVVKIPFMGEYIEDTDEYVDFHGSNDFLPIDQTNDYCAGEVYITKKAEEEGLGYMFAKTYYLGDFNNYPVYVAEKITTSYWGGACRKWQDEMSSKEIAKNIERSHENLLYDSRLDERTVAHFVDIYGELKTYELLDFIEEMKISDLHNGNMGFTKDMKIKILDYSGYNS